MSSRFTDFEITDVSAIYSGQKITITEVEIPDADLIESVAGQFSPEEVFEDVEELNEWARNNGWVKEE